ncbi:MAG: DUF3791 domain-containing protein [Clostridia bacterium]|nr:DUF3791 domain-containing protein [Clostridia bacterium]
MTEQRKQINYVIALVNEFAARHNLSKKQAFQYMYDYKAIEFIKEFYDIEHTLSFDEVVEDCTRICRNNGGVLTL